VPGRNSYEHSFQDLQHAFEFLQGVLAPRGLFVDVSILFVDNLRTNELRDVSVELIVRRRASGHVVWRGVDGLRVPGRAKLRSVATSLFGLMMRAAIDVEEALPLPGGGSSKPQGRART